MIFLKFVCVYDISRAGQCVTPSCSGLVSALSLRRSAAGIGTIVSPGTAAGEDAAPVFCWYTASITGLDAKKTKGDPWNP